MFFSLLVLSVDVQIGFGKFQFEKVAAPGDVQRPGFGTGAQARFEDVVDVFGAERAAFGGVGHRPLQRVAAVDVGHCIDAVDVAAPGGTLFAQRGQIGRRVGPQRQEAGEALTVSGMAHFKDQSPFVIGIGDGRPAGRLQDCG